MLALSVRHPWAWAIVHGGKDIENRSWRTQVRGRILIHAAQRYDAAGEAAVRAMCPGFPGRAALACGGIIGSVEITECVECSASRWFEGPIGFVLSRPLEVPFRPLPGKLGFFRVEDAPKPA
jgi:hypothetical protein